MNQITPAELAELLKQQPGLQLIDVREQYEHEAFNIGGELIPLGDILKHADTIEKEKPVIIYCRMGVRSQVAIQRLQQKFPFNNLINLQGGTEAWKKQFPPNS